MPSSGCPCEIADELAEAAADSGADSGATAGIGPVDVMPACPGCGPAPGTRGGPSVPLPPSACTGVNRGARAAATSSSVDVCPAAPDHPLASPAVSATPGASDGPARSAGLAGPPG